MTLMAFFVKPCIDDQIVLIGNRYYLQLLTIIARSAYICWFSI